MGSFVLHYLRIGGAAAGLCLIVAGPAWAQMNMPSGGMQDMSKGDMSKSDTAKDDSGPSFRVGDIVVQTPWTRATPGGAKIAGGYMIIKNTGTQPDHLVSLTTDVAGKSQMHEMSMNNGIMTMRPLSGSLEIAPGASVEFKPSGYHVMFEDLKQPFKVGEQIKTTLQFEKAGALEVSFAVGPIGATRPPSALPH